MTSVNTPVILAISNGKEFEKFLNSTMQSCVLMNMHLSFVGDFLKQAHGKGKTVFLHIDLIKGISSDEAGCEYVCQALGADGIISTKGKVVETAKRLKKIAILRMFLIDSQSLKKGIKMIEELHPDYVEVLPGLASAIVPELISQTKASFLCGGLISSKEQIETCLSNGAVAVTISDLKTAEAFLAESDKRK